MRSKRLYIASGVIDLIISVGILAFAIWLAVLLYLAVSDITASKDFMGIGAIPASIVGAIFVIFLLFACYRCGSLGIKTLLAVKKDEVDEATLLIKKSFRTCLFLALFCVIGIVLEVMEIIDKGWSAEMLLIFMLYIIPLADFGLKFAILKINKPND